MSVPTRGLSDMLDALTGGTQDDENKSKIHVTEEVQMHRVAAAAAAGSASAPNLPNVGVAANITLDQQNTWKALMDMQQQMISFQTGLMRVLETATIAAAAARGAADAAQASGRPSESPEPASVPSVRFGHSATRIHPIKELHDEALKYFEKQALLHERNVLKLVRTQREIERLTTVISAMEQSKYNELKFIYPPGTSPFKAPSDVVEMNESLQESSESDYVVSFTIPRGSSRRTAMNICHHVSNTFIRKVTLQAQTAHLASVKSLSSKQVFLQSCASLKFKQQEWPDLGLEDVDRQCVDRKAAEHHALEIYRRMIDKVRRKAADDEKKKEEDLKKKEEVSKKLEEAKPGNLLVSVVRKVIKEEQGDSNMGVETKNDGDVVKDIEQAADAFASRVVAGRSVEKDTIHKGKGNESSSKEKTLPKKGKGKGNSKGKNGKLGKIEKKDGKGSKNVVSPGKAGGKGTNKDGKKNTRKGGTKGKNKGDKNGGKAKKGQN